MELTELTEFISFDHIEYLLQKRFSLHKFTGRNLLRTYETPEDFQKATAAVQLYLQELHGKSPMQIVLLCKQEKEKERQAAQIKAELEEQQRFFNLPEVTDVDFEYWAKATYWTLDEAIALSFGRNPKRVSWVNVQHYTAISPFAKKYSEVHELVVRAKNWKQLSDPALPGAFLAWAERNDIQCNPKLMEAIAARGIVIADWKTAYDQLKKTHDQFVTQREKEIFSLKQEITSLAEKLKQPKQEVITQPQTEKQLSTRERNTLLKLIISMAISGYSYDPEDKKSSAIREIVEDLQRNGMSVDAATVRKWLKEACGLLPRETE